MQIDVIFEDNHQLVLNKPAGLLTQPSGTSQPSLEEQAKIWLKQKYNKPGNVFLEAVHRIDKPVSGIVLFAKTSKGLSRLQEGMREKLSKKVYLAIVEGDVKQPEGRLEHYLLHDHHKAFVATQANPEAKKAVLTFRVLQRHQHLTLLEIHLETGRYHQIRVQLATEGHAILGDSKYGSTYPYLPESIALHHHILEIPHPITSQIQHFESLNPFLLDYFRKIS